MVNYPNLNKSAKLLDDYLTDGETHTIIEVIQKAQEINPNIPAHIIGSDKPNTIAVELYCKVEDRSVKVPLKENEFSKVKASDVILKHTPILAPFIKPPSIIEVKIGFWKRLYIKLKKMFQ